MFRKLYIKWLVWRGKAIDIWSKSEYPADVLSNLCSNGFRFDGMVCGSMEGFLQSLKQKDKNKQRQICSMKGKNAKKMTSTGWQTDQIVWWEGNAIDRQGKEYQDLLRRAYQAMFEQNERFRTALMSTRGMTLYHCRGESNAFKTILTEQEFCKILTELRDNYDKRVVLIKTENINPVGRHPEDILSIQCNNSFCIDDVQCGSMESFLQSLKYQDIECQRKICVMDGNEAHKYSTTDWQRDQVLWWKGVPIKRNSSEYKRLIRRAYDAMYWWSGRFRDILMSTEGKELRCNSGRDDPHKTIFTDKEFCEILTDLRTSNKLAYRTVLYPRLWPNSYGVEEDYI